MAETTTDAQAGRTHTVKIWDVAVRLFHWALVLLVVASWTTAKAKGNWMAWHVYSGYAVLTLVLFRVAWGFIGSTHARFSSFVYGPSTVMRYVFGRGRLQSVAYLGHNALGGWMVIALLISLMFQAGTGLLANDDVLTEGPLVKWISKELSDRVTALHSFGFDALIVLIVLHICGVLFYLLVKKDNLIVPMFTGNKTVPEHAADAAQMTVRMLERRQMPRSPQTQRRRRGRPSEVRIVRAWVAAIVLGATAALVYLLVTFGPANPG